MTSAGLREELKCSICLNLYTEPISLKCGHHFCWDCIATAMDTQEESGNYSCPECTEQYPERPLLEKNRKLCNIVDCFRSANQEETEVLCTYCDSPVPAFKSCLQCESSFCDKHLSNHSKLIDHSLTEPTTSFRDRKCSTHQETLKYYCTEDSACVCMSCFVAGGHRRHQVELLNEASEKIKEKLRKTIDALDSERQEIRRRIQIVNTHRTQVKEKAIAFTRSIAKLITEIRSSAELCTEIRSIAELFTEIRNQLDDVEKGIIYEMQRQGKQIAQSTSYLYLALLKQNDELSRQMNQMKELRNIHNPLTILKNAPNTDDMRPAIVDTDNELRNSGHLTEGIISYMLQKGLCNITHSFNDLVGKAQFPVMKKSNILLDVHTAHDNLIISKIRKRISHIDSAVSRPEDPKRFNWRQVFSIQSFIFLEYEAGRLSFYQLCGPVRHLCTFTTTFTEPLQAAFCVFPMSSVRIIT